MTLPQPTGMRLLPRSPYCLSSEGESRLAVASYFVLPPFYEARRHLGSRSLVSEPCRNHASPQVPVHLSMRQNMHSRPNPPESPYPTESLRINARPRPPGRRPERSTDRARCTLPRMNDDLRSELEQIERRRVALLVAGELDAAAELHADDFQLITPRGIALSKADYLGAIRTGDITYLRWQPGPIEVRGYGDAALLRYQAEMEMPGSTARLWHTDLYELRDGRWQVVWSQATRCAE
jgi:hypothetical protein